MRSEEYHEPSALGLIRQPVQPLLDRLLPVASHLEAAFVEPHFVAPTAHIVGQPPGKLHVLVVTVADEDPQTLRLAHAASERFRVTMSTSLLSETGAWLYSDGRAEGTTRAACAAAPRSP